MLVWMAIRRTIIWIVDSTMRLRPTRGGKCDASLWGYVGLCVGAGTYRHDRRKAGS